MTELGRDPGFALQAFDVQAGFKRVLMGDLEGDDAIELGIARTPDRAEGALADAIEQLKSADDADLVERHAIAGSLQAERVAAFLARHVSRQQVARRNRVVAGRADQTIRRQGRRLCLELMG